ncbi:bifunctional demethylmenaquinone methyltransferase/2-methoxy-6-polyprenyl-1,4-benzoquinol methylase UbiE [Balneolaceae bacterium ANBcel3]|nr:bifunctional demethylmenaquinone methyltransferase/2-methoxy-6-polyprenyl-1,4-benzoquinol methylase UbiE [Balneolaceae bacterium ANBcel3]
MSEEVRRMFSSIADRYDLLNTVLSLGIHHRWRKKTVKASGARQGMSVLDCATGTGDLAIAFKKAVGSKGKVTGTDFSAEMIRKAPEKAGRLDMKIEWQVADAMNLPFDDQTYDISSIAFGIRNVDDPKHVLREMARVVKPNGKVMVLEFGQPEGLIKYPYRWHSKYIIPKIGGWISGNRQAYEYLPETSAAFPAGGAFLRMMKQTTCFEECSSTSLMSGIAYIYTGIVR